MTELLDTFVLEMVEQAFPDEAKQLGDLPWVQVNIPSRFFNKEHVGCLCDCHVKKAMRENDPVQTIHIPTVPMRRMHVYEVDGLEDEYGGSVQWVAFVGQCPRCYKVFYCAEPII